MSTQELKQSCSLDTIMVQDGNLALEVYYIFSREKNRNWRNSTHSIKQYLDKLTIKELLDIRQNLQQLSDMFPNFIFKKTWHIGL